MQKIITSGVLKKAQTKGDKTTKCDKVMDELITEHHTPQGDKNIACSNNLIFFFFFNLGYYLCNMLPRGPQCSPCSLPPLVVVVVVVAARLNERLSVDHDLI